MQNYDKGLFYLDAALSEDIKTTRRKNCPDKWKEQPAYLALKLEGTARQVAQRVIDRTKAALQKQLDRWTGIAKSPGWEQQISIDAFVAKFVSRLIEEEIKHQTDEPNPYRSLITAFYAFLLEFEDRCVELALRSDEGGSVEPFIVHLFRGGLLFESLLKYLYSNKKKLWTIRNIFEDSAFQRDFMEGLESKTSADSLEQIIHDVTDNSLKTAFKTTAQLRNTAGHNLVWSGVFSDPVNYSRLVEQEINALFYIIQKKFLSQ